MDVSVTKGHFENTQQARNERIPAVYLLSQTVGALANWLSCTPTVQKHYSQVVFSSSSVGCQQLPFLFIIFLLTLLSFHFWQLN